MINYDVDCPFEHLVRAFRVIRYEVDHKCVNKVVISSLSNIEKQFDVHVSEDFTILNRVALNVHLDGERVIILPWDHCYYATLSESDYYHEILLSLLHEIGHCYFPDMEGPILEDHVEAWAEDKYDELQSRDLL